MDARSQRDIRMARSARYGLPSPQNRNCAILTVPQAPLEYGKLFPGAFPRTRRKLRVACPQMAASMQPLSPSAGESQLNAAIRRWFLGIPIRTMEEDDYGVREGGGNASLLE